jgi:hypothetical protein
MMDERCDNPEHEHAPIYCMWHQFLRREHEAGQICFECGLQWFYAEDWSTPECRAMLERERRSRRYRWGVQFDRLLSGWKWRAVWKFYR